MDKLFSIEELDRWATASVPKKLHYFAREDFQAICKYAADTMRALKAYRDAWVDNESESDMMTKLSNAEDSAVKLCGDYSYKDSV